MEGGEEENTYPNKAWLPASGVQRGSLYTMPGSGDPQTPGIAALTGMYRRPRNESELPPIPAHPMGYGDAINFLQEMSGNRLGKKYVKFPNINHAHALSSACVLVFNRVLTHVLKYTSSHAIALLCNFLVKLNPIVVTSLVLPERFSSFIICQKGCFKNLPGALLKTGKSF